MNKLTPIKKQGKASNGDPLWLCQCDCGNTIVVRQTNLRSGRTRSCGCLKKKGIEIIPGKKISKYANDEYVSKVSKYGKYENDEQVKECDEPNISADDLPFIFPNDLYEPINKNTKVLYQEKEMKLIKAIALYANEQNLNEQIIKDIYKI